MITKLDDAPHSSSGFPLSSRERGTGGEVRSPWPLVPLGEVMQTRKHFIQIDDTTEYKRCRVQLHAQGVVQRDIVSGAEVKTKSQQVCRSGEFLVAEIDAKVGGFGIVPHALDGAIVSSHYFLFVVDESQLDQRFLDFYVRTHDFQEQVRAQGSTNYAAVRPSDVLSYTIPLPPLAEQRRIVAHIEALAGRIAEARRLRQEALAEAEALWKAALNAVWSNEAIWATFSLEDMARTVSGQVDPQVEPYINLPHINGESMESGTCRLLPNFRSASDDQVTSGKYHFHGGAVLYSKIRPYLMKSVQVPFEGICSADVYAFEDFDTRLLPRFFMYSLISPRFTRYAVDLSGRTRMPKLNQSQLFGYSLRVPLLDEQQHIVDYLDGLQSQLDALKRHQTETAAELDALLPAVLDRAFRGEL